MVGDVTLSTCPNQQLSFVWGMGHMIERLTFHRRKLAYSPTYVTLISCASTPLALLTHATVAKIPLLGAVVLVLDRGKNQIETSSCLAPAQQITTGCVGSVGQAIMQTLHATMHQIREPPSGLPHTTS
jgi:hypothetical protein